MSVLSLSYWESDIYWRQNNKHFADFAPQNGGKQLIWRNYVTVTLCIHKYRVGQHSFSYCSPKIRSEMPDTIKVSAALVAYKHWLKSYLFSKLATHDTINLTDHTSYFRFLLHCSSFSNPDKKPSYRWGTARRGRASWNLVKFCTNVDDLYLKRSETRLLPIRL